MHAINVSLRLCVLCSVLTVVAGFEPTVPTFSDQLVVQLKYGIDAEGIETFGRNHHLKFIRKVFDDDDLYLFKILRHDKNRRINTTISTSIARSKNVLWFEQQTREVRDFRHVVPSYENNDFTRKRPEKSRDVSFNDPHYADQWYLHNEGQTGGVVGNDLNVLPVWKAGFTGSGVVISVLDDGIQHTNLDLKDNYDPSISYDMVDLEDGISDPSPDLNGDNGHGTSCAAVIAAVGNNSICGVGIAFNAKIGGLRVMDGKVADIQEALSLVYGLNKVDIYSASWGPRDDGQHLAGPRKLASKALKKGIKLGRKGKGAIYVWAVGNGNLNYDNCNLDGYVSSIFTIAIGALTYDGLSVYYSEPCTSILASAYVGGLKKKSLSQPSTARGANASGTPLVINWNAILKDERQIKVVVPDLSGKCTNDFQGTSAAAPQAAGVIALALEANPALSWRDVQHLIVHSSRLPNAQESGWSVNGAGLHFHPSYGFGAIDAARMVAAAQQWTPIGPQVKFTIRSSETPTPIRCHSNLTLHLVVSSGDKCGPGSTYDTICNQASAASPSTVCLSHLEHVVASVDIQHPNRKWISLYLLSPAGTTSQLLTQRKLDTRSNGIRMWDFMSVQFWDERPSGVWTFVLADNSGQCSTSGSTADRLEPVARLNQLWLTLYGSCGGRAGSATSVKNNSGSGSRSALRGVGRNRKRAYVPDMAGRKWIVESEKRLTKRIRIIDNDN